MRFVNTIRVNFACFELFTQNELFIAISVRFEINLFIGGDLW